MAHQYQKVYMNQIHSSSLLCQLSQMWKSQLLCDAHIQTGTTTTKAHRVVLVAACPMLQSMGPSETGSDLKIRLPSDIRAESVCTFLQYLYEGFTTLTDINIHEVEKIARLLQVDCLIKCCADFNKTLNREVGLPIYSQSQYKYTFHDMFEFRHVRHSDLVRLSQNRSCKRPPSGVSSEEKRPRLNDLDPRRSGVLLPSTSSQIVNDSDSHKYTVSLLNQVADDKISMAETYNNSSTQSSSQAVTSVRSDDCVIVEDEQKTFEEGIEMSEKPSRHTMQSSPAEPHVQDVGSVGVFVSCQTNMDKSVQEVNMETDNTTTSLGEETDHSSSASSAVQKCADTSTTKSSHAESKGSFPHEAPLIATVVDCPEEEPTNCAIEENCQVRSPSEKDFTPIGSPPDVEKDGPPDVPSAMPGPAETEPENPTSSQQSDDSPNSPLVESRMDHIANANNSVSPTPSDSTPDLSIIKVERVNHDGEFLGLSMHVDMEDCEDYDREDYRGDELDESRLSGLSEGGATEHGTAWFVGTFKVYGMIIYIDTSSEPAEQGFFCDDRSLKYPNLENTISVPALYVISHGVPILFVLISHFHTHKCGIDMRLHHTLCSYLLGSGILHLTANIVKVKLGKLRPNFFAVCRPDIQYPCTGQFINYYKCKGLDVEKIRHSRLSFPSLHAAVSTYGMVFLIIFIQTRYVRRTAFCLVWKCIQGCCMMWFCITSVSRIVDNKHHWADVIAGFLAGLAMSVWVAYQWAQITELRGTPP